MSDEMGRSRPPRAFDADTEHAIKNHLAIIVGFTELLLGETPPEDSRHADLQEIDRAARELMTIFEREPRP